MARRGAQTGAKVGRGQRSVKNVGRGLAGGRGVGAGEDRHWGEKDGTFLLAAGLIY